MMKFALALACATVVMMMGAASAGVILEWQGNTLQRLRNCCQSPQAVSNAIASFLEDQTEQCQVRGMCTDEEGEDNAWVALADPDIGNPDWWDIQSFTCTPAFVYYRPGEQRLGMIVDAWTSSGKFISLSPRTAPSFSSGSASTSSGSRMRAPAFARPRTAHLQPHDFAAAAAATSDPVLSVFQSAFSKLSMSTSVSIGGCTSKLSSMDLCNQGGHDKTFKVSSLAATSYASTGTPSKPSSITLSISGHVDYEYDHEETFCHGGPAPVCRTFHEWKCCQTNDWNPSLHVVLTYSCDATGAHGFTSSGVTGTGYGGSDSAMNSIVNTVLATITVPKSQDAPFCPPS